MANHSYIVNMWGATVKCHAAPEPPRPDVRRQVGRQDQRVVLRAQGRRVEQDRIAEAIRDHRRADRTYVDSGVRLLELASGAHDAFMSQASEERHKLLQLLVSTPHGSTAG